MKSFNTFWMTSILISLHLIILVISAILISKDMVWEDVTEDDWIITLCFSLELIFNFIAIWLYVAWMVALKHSPGIHWNLKIACLAECIVMINSCWLRYPIILNWFSTSKFLDKRLTQILSILRDIVITHCYTTHACIAIERTLATYFVDKYEYFASKKRWIAFLFFTEFITIGLYYLFLAYWDNYAIAAVFLIILEACVGTLCICLIKVNTRNYSKTQGLLILSTRYQLAENIRSLRPVLIFSVFANTYNLLSISFISTVYILFIDDQHEYFTNYVHAVWNLLCSFFAILYPLPFILKSRYYRRLLQKQFSCRRATVSPQKLVLYSVTGRKLTVDNEEKFYFQDLHKAWN